MNLAVIRKFSITISVDLNFDGIESKNRQKLVDRIVSHNGTHWISG
jgi:hypothetical protein